MYKKASELHSWLTRSGNSSTRLKKTGDNTDSAILGYDIQYVVDAVARNFVRRAEIDEEIEQATLGMIDINIKLQEFNEGLIEAVPYDEFIGARLNKQVYIKKKIKLERRIVALKAERRKVNCESYVDVLNRDDEGSFVHLALFRLVAEEVLPAYVYEQIETAVKAAKTDKKK